MDPDKETRRFRVLLAEDDPVSREFLVEALNASGVATTACADGAAALALARSGHWDLLLLDHQLPGLAGDAVLAALREAAGRGGSCPPAIAITAAAAEDRNALLRAGFIEVLRKPITIGDLRHAVRRHGAPGCASLDDAAGLRACGNPDVLARLRRLFAEQELPAILACVDQSHDDPHSLRPILHRLRASCGFCGTASLAEAAEVLHRSLPHGSREEIAAALSAFRNALVETRDALHALPDVVD